MTKIDWIFIHQDFDQCAEPGFDCGANGACNDFLGGYYCTCDSGYEVDNSSEPNKCVGRCSTLWTHEVLITCFVISVLFW